MAPTSLRIALIQTAVSDDIDVNLAKTAQLIAQAASQGARIVALEELFATRYFAQVEHKELFSHAETIPGKTSEWLSEQARNNNITLVGGSLFEKDGDSYYNTALIFDPLGKQIGKYRKTHIPHDPNYFEQFYFLPGDTGYIQVDVDGVKIAPLICYDQWYPEAARSNVLEGAKILFYPTAIGWFDYMKKTEPFSAQRWEDAMRSHASLNGIYVAAINRVGTEDKMTFWGGSFVADPFGQVIKKASDSSDEVVVVDIDLSKIEESQEGWGFLRNRKPQTYHPLTK